VYGIDSVKRCGFFLNIKLIFIIKSGFLMVYGKLVPMSFPGKMKHFAGDKK